MDHVLGGVDMYLKRSYPKEIQESIVKDFLDENYALRDLTHKYQIHYECLRAILIAKFETHRLLQFRKKYRSKFFGEGDRHKLNVRKSKVIPIVLDLINEKELSYADIARKHSVSRERVGQIAEQCARSGQEVSRANSPNIRGKAA